jgi:hypothetical protein
MDQAPLRATIRCPSCGQASEATMPEDACVYFLECPACKTIVRPKAGDCCVFCSYGTGSCPPKASLPSTAPRGGGSQ